MRILFAFTFILAGLSSSLTYSQIQTRELPPDFLNSKENSNSAAYTVQLNDPNLNAIKAEDLVEDQLKDFGWRFGTVINANYDLTNSGLWSYNDNNGNATWKLKISFQQAVSINLNFDLFKLSPNAKLFVHNDDFTDILGAITDVNNKEDLQFSIRPIKGNNITLVFEVPQTEIGNNLISIHEIIYGYRSIHDKIQTVFNSSQSCNVNINCSEGDNWQDVKRAVAMVTSGSNTRMCSGTLINNVKQDSTPYFLTAAHCGIQNNAIFIFGYESSLCNPNTDGSLANSISGSSRKAITEKLGSDFELRELSSTPPLSYNVYYAGWNNQNLPTAKSVAIHHPLGDVKKISFNNNRTYDGTYNRSGANNTHWVIDNWTVGSTQDGSSGSALFDMSHRIIGQLHGGSAACGNNLKDYYGKFSHSWNFSSDTLKQLKHWLDPDNTGTVVLDGMDPNPAALNYDLTMLDIGGIPDFECTQTIIPFFRIQNIGNSTIDSFYVDIQFNGGSSQTLIYRSPLKRQAIAIVRPSNFSPINGGNILKATVRIAGNITDQNLSNNTNTLNFVVNTALTEKIQITLKTDDYGYETSWELIDDSNDNLIVAGSGYPYLIGGGTYKDTFCIYNGCFRLNLFDLVRDGFNTPSGVSGNGSLLVTKNEIDTLYFENNFTTAFTSDTFCTKFTTGLATNNVQKHNITAFPNPVIAGELLQISGNIISNLKLRSVTGQLLIETVGTQIIIPNELPKGIYFLEIRNSTNKKLLDTKKVLVK